MTVIKQDDLIQSIADALQFISYYHPTDFIRAMRGAWEKEESPAAKAALTQVLVNSRMCAIGKRPICQDTGIVNVLVSVGMDVQWDADMAFEDMINEGVRRQTGMTLDEWNEDQAARRARAKAAFHGRKAPAEKRQQEQHPEDLARREEQGADALGSDFFA